MKETISGRIINVNVDERIISIIHKNKLKLFYLQRSMMNQYSRYIKDGVFIHFVVVEEARIFHGYKVQNVEHIKKMQVFRYRKSKTFYDAEEIRSGIKDLINELDNKLFLDLEMSMHPYTVDKSFVQEIIQVGYLLVDKNGKTIKEYNKLIKPKLHPRLTPRTKKFLKITQEDVNNGINYLEFYNEFKEIIKKYNPAIIVWGKNDSLALRDSYKIHNVESLCSSSRYLNLLKVHKTYLNLKNDLGLFNAYGLYYEPFDQQNHDAFEDAVVTNKICNGFKKLVNGELDMPVHDYK